MSMSERTVIVVEFPIERDPDVTEYRRLLKQSYSEARKQMKNKGEVLGIIEVARATRKMDGADCLVVRLAVRCPIEVQLAAMN